MYKFSEIISYPVISLYESEMHGFVYNILIDKNQKKCSYVQIRTELDGIERIINVNCIYKIGKSCLFIKNNTNIELNCNNNHISDNFINPINKSAFNTSGEYLGCITDVEFDYKFNVINLIIDNSFKINNKDIYNLGNSIILIKDHSENNIRITKFKPQKKLDLMNVIDNKVIILNQDNNSQPERIATNDKFLTNRHVMKDIIANNGEIIAKKNSVISKTTIQKASQYGKLVELARFSTKYE